jgi:hypothetical protein
MPISLTGRLLCAAQQTYLIKVAGVTPVSPPTPAPPPSTLVGWLVDPPCYVGGQDEINAALVGETATEIIAAFRGTEPFDSPNKGQMILDWLDDLDAIPTQYPNMPGLVHPGFMGGVDSLWPAVWGEIQNRLQASPGKPLYITGHSKGGALADLAAIKCTLEPGGVQPYVCTFEGARCGDQTFATAYDAAVPHSVRYEYQDDIVPHLPPGAAFAEILKKVPFLSAKASTLYVGYASAGTLSFIDWQNQIVPDSPALDIERLLRLARLMFQPGGFDRIIKDHGISPGSGCASVICPGIWSAV